MTVAAGKGFGFVVPEVKKKKSCSLNVCLEE